MTAVPNLLAAGRHAHGVMSSKCPMSRVMAVDEAAELAALAAGVEAPYLAGEPDSGVPRPTLAYAATALTKACAGRTVTDSGVTAYAAASSRSICELVPRPWR